MMTIVCRVLLAGFLSFVVYPLSFAPLDRLIYGDDSVEGTFRTRRLLVFAPVTYLIDYTPADRALLWWSSVWRVEGRHITDRWLRPDGCYGIGGEPGADVAPPSPWDWW